MVRSVFQSVLPGKADAPRWQAAYVHLANGLYVNTLANRLVLRFWPSPHDLAGILTPAENALRRQHRTLLDVAKAPDPAEANRASEAERARIAAGFQALRDDLQRRTGEVRRDAPRPSYLVGPALEAARAKLRQQA